MKKIIYVLTLSIAFTAYGQDKSALDNYERDFVKVATTDMKEKEVEELMDKYEGLFFTENNETPLKYFPLMLFKETKAYKNNIKKLLNSKKPMYRILAYKTIGSAADTNYNATILTQLKSDTNEVALQWAAMCLFYNRNQSTDELFDFVIKHDDFTDQHFYKWYLRLDTTHLKATAWKYIATNKYPDDELNLNRKAQIYTIQILANIDQSKEVDSLIVQSVHNWDNDYKGYAIAALNYRNNLEKYNLLAPYLENEITKNISIRVLEKSSFQSDRDKLAQWKRKKQD